MRRPCSCEICNYTVNGGCVHYWYEEYLSLRDAARKVVDMAFVTQLNNREAILPPMQQLQDVLFQKKVR